MPIIYLELRCDSISSVLGDLLRSQISAKTDLGLRAKQFVDAGSLVPDDVMSTLIVHELKLMKEDSWLLDGQ